MKPDLNNKPIIPHGWLRALLFIVFYFSLLTITGYVQGQFFKPAPQTEAGNTAASSWYMIFIVYALISVVSVWLFRKLIDRQSFESMGFGIAKNGMHAGAGFFLGILILCTGSCIFYFGKMLQWTNISFNGNSLFISLGLMIIVACYEELVFRGYILNNLLASLNKWVALLIAAFIFALAHLANPSFSVVGAVNIFLAGLLLGINYIYTKNLWFGIMLHFTWNFFQGPVLGYEVSGMTLQSLLQHEMQGNELLTGGKFGFEGSLMATVLTIITIAALALLYEKKYAPLATANPVK